MFWNVENFFDTKKDNKTDDEFYSKGARRWTNKRFNIKCNAISKTICYIADIYNKFPDVIGFAEIENKNVLLSLINATTLYKQKYKIVHFESLDTRGIDVGLIYNSLTCKLLSAKPCRVYGYDGKPLKTRDILLVGLEINKTAYHFIVCHFPSKYGGEKSADKRKIAVDNFLHITDSLQALNYNNIVAMGDFNESATNTLFSPINKVLCNKAIIGDKNIIQNKEDYNSIDTKHNSKNYGTIRFKGEWSLIDIFFVSNNLNTCSDMYILQLPFLMQYDKMYHGYKPFRTYNGPKYIGGVSDHCPIVLKISN